MKQIKRLCGLVFALVLTVLSINGTTISASNSYNAIQHAYYNNTDIYIKVVLHYDDNGNYTYESGRAVGCVYDTRGACFVVDYYSDMTFSSDKTKCYITVRGWNIDKNCYIVSSVLTMKLTFTAGEGNIYIPKYEYV